MRKREYDFIILGGGTAGCLLAKLLVEANAGTVALIEAGVSGRREGLPPEVRTVVPAFYPRTFGSPIDWAYKTEPQAGLNGRRIAWPRGKVLGGSSAINALIYLQAAPADFNRWSANGCAGWDWQAVVRRVPHLNQSNQPFVANRCPASDLPLNTITTPHPWSKAFIQACIESGFVEHKPWLQSTDRSCGLFTLTMENGRRRHTGAQLLDELPNLNIDVISGMTVNKLNLVADRVSSVELLDSSNCAIQLQTSNRVILCAGTIGSPSILQRSGIGPADQLTRLGIQPHLDLPGVGANLQDHLVFPLVFRTNDYDGLPARFDAAARRQYREWIDAGEYCPLASNIAEAGSVYSIDTAQTPDIQIHFTPTHYLKYPSRNAPINHCSLTVTDLHPRSRGKLLVRDADPNSVPLLDPAYLSDDEDVCRVLKGIDTVRAIASGAALRNLIVEEVLPGKRRIDASALMRSVKMYALSIYHPVGTCRMGVDPQAVVDSTLRVHGLSNLFVADASVLPDLPSGNTQAAALLIGRIASQLLTCG